jgi:hypothetical protein
MNTLLYIDLLGGRAKWREGGATASKQAFDQFSRLMIAACHPDVNSIVTGGIETDSAAIVCSDVVAALNIGRRAYLWAFKKGHGLKAERMWLRGAVVPYPNDEPFRRDRTATPPSDQLRVYTYSEPLFDAISVEKSGFKGMRLLVRDSLITPSVRADLRITHGNVYIVPIKRLCHSPYPHGQTSDIQDYLWMATLDEEEESDLNLRMARRLRSSAADGEEFLQAAATQLVFHECLAICHGMKSRIKRARKRRAG